MEESTELVHGFSQAIAKDLHSEFKLTYQRPDKSPSGRPTFYLDGPEQYIEHGGLAGLLDDIPAWLPKTGRYDKEGRIEVRGPYKRIMVAKLFTNIADNITFYLVYGTKRKALFLSDMRGETDFLDWLNGDDEQMTAKTLALRELEHCVPVLTELPIATILRIRKEEKEAFQSYRDSVAAMSSSILAADKRVSKGQAREMFRDAIEPELRKMKKEIRTYQKVSLEKTVAGFASLFAGVLIGAYAGLPPLVSVPFVATSTIVGGNLLLKAADAACEHGLELKQKNDLYFLLRLTKEA